MTHNRNKVVDSVLFKLNANPPAGVPLATRTNFLSSSPLSKEINVMTLQEDVQTTQQTQSRTLTILITCLATGFVDGGQDTEQLLDNLVQHVESAVGTGKLLDPAGLQVGSIELDNIAWTAKPSEQLVAICTLTYRVKYLNNLYPSNP